MLSPFLESVMTEHNEDLALRVRGLPEGTLKALDQLARDAGMSREALIRQKLVEMAEAPRVVQRYALRAVSVESGGRVTIRREHNGIVNVVGQGWSEAQASTIRDAKDLMERNHQGDREQAIALLWGAFDSVVEVN